MLIRLEGLLEREAQYLVARDAAQLGAVAEEREHVTLRLVSAARQRRASGATDDAELAARYRRLRQRHEIQAHVVRRHAEANARALGVLAQAAGQSNLYRADGRVPLQYLAS